MSALDEFLQQPLAGDPTAEEQPVSQHDFFGSMIDDAASAYSPVPERKPVDKSLWSKLKWLDAPRNGAFDVAWRMASGDGDVIGGGIRGLKNDEHVSGVDLINAMNKDSNPAAHTAWRIKQAQLGLLPDELARQVLSGDENEIDKLSNPYGTAGKVLGFGLEMLLDPLNLASLGLTKAARFGAEAARGAGLERRLTQAVVGADAPTAIDMIQGARSPLAKRAFAVPGNIEAALDVKAQRALGMGAEIDAAEEKVASLVKARSLVPKIKEAGKGLRVAKKSVDLGEEGADAAFATARENLTGIKAQYASLMAETKALSPKEMLMGAVSLADKGILGEIHQELNAAIGGAMEEGIFGKAATKYDNPAAGIGMLTASGKRIAQNLEDLGLYLHPELGRMIVTPDMASFEALMATSRARNVLDELGMSARLTGEPGIINANLVKEVRKYTDKAKLPPDILNNAGPEIVDAIEESRKVSALLQDEGFLNRYYITPTAADLVQHSQEDLALMAHASSVLKSISQKLYVNDKGIELMQRVPVRTKLSRIGMDKDFFGKLDFVSKTEEKIVPTGQGFLGESAKELAGQRKVLSDALGNFAVKSRENIANVMEAMYAQQAAIKPDSWIGQQVAKIPLAKRLTMPGSGTPMFGFFLGRDPERVFRGTGVFELLMTRTRSFTEADNYYQGIRREITGGLSQEERSALGEALLKSRKEGVPIPEEELALLGQKATDSYRRIRDLRMEMADLQGMPYDERVHEYFTRLIDRDAKMTDALSKGHIPPEFTRDSVVIGDMLKRSDIAREWKSRFLKRAGAATHDYVTDVDDVLRVYIKSSLKAHYLSPAFKEAGTLLLGSEVKPGIRTATGDVIGARATPGIINIRAANDPKVMGMVQYLKDLENTVHGIPTKLTETIAGKVANVADQFGWEFANTPEKAVSFASKVSGALMRNTYRSTIGGLVPTPLQNLTQNILTAGEYGPMTTWKALVGTIAKQDPMEHVIAGGAKEGRAAFLKSEKEKLLQNFGDLYDVKADASTVRGMTARLVQHYDHEMFRYMRGSEALNRGTAFAVGMNYAKRMNLGAYDALRMSHQVSDETQFLYGMMGRAPLFHDPFLRPFVAPFSSYPQKMVGSLSRMLRENPTSFVRYLSFMGGVSNAVGRLNIDPANLFNFAYLPNRFLLVAPITPLARAMGAAYDLAGMAVKGDADSEQWDRSKANLVEGLMFGGFMPLPVGSARAVWEQYNLWHNDQVQSSREFVKHVVPGVRGLFDGEIPKVLLREDDETRKFAISAAKLFGFHSEGERIASKVMEDLNDARNDYRKLRMDVVRIYKKNGNFADLDEEDLAKMRELAIEGGPDAIKGVVESINSGYQTIATRGLDGASRSQEAQIRSGIAGIPDPGLRRQTYGMELSRQALKRDVDQQLGRRAGPQDVSPEWE